MKFLYTSLRNLAMISAGILFSLFFTTCIKDEIDMTKVSNTVNWNPKLGVPLAYGDISLKDILDAVDSTGLIREYPDGLLYLLYRSHIFSKTLDSIFALPNQQYQELFYGSDLPPFGVDSLKYQQKSNYAIQPTNGEEIDSIFLKAGQLKFSIMSEFHHYGRISVIVTSLTKNGKPLEFTIPINRNDGSFIDSITFDISGYKLGLNPGNQLPFEYVVAFANSGDPIISTQRMRIRAEIQHMSLRSFFGYIANYPIIENISDRIKIDFFENSLSSNIQFNNPQFRIILSNSFGIPVRLQLSNTRAESNKNGTVNLDLAPSINPFDVPYPNINQIGQRIKDTLLINNSNSNLSAAINIAPQVIYFTASATTNPSGKTFNFALDTSRLDLDLEVELPIYIRASNFEMSDTMDFDLSGIVSDYSIVDKLAVNATFVNSIPFDLGVQLFLTDENYTIVDTLFSTTQQPIIASGVIDSNGKVVNPTSKTTQVLYDSKDAKRLENVKYAIVHGSITTAGKGQTYVKFYSSYKFNVSLGAQIELKIRSLDQM